ncbi:MAG: TonB-dependent receptor domain-containing protein [Verrucomicrobiota bacterium]
MKRLIGVGHGTVAAVCLSLFTLGIASSYGQAPAANASTNQIRIVEAQGTVEVLPGGSTTWTRGQLNQTLKPLDRLRTGANSRVALRWSDQTVIPFDAGTELEILPPASGDSDNGLRLSRGVLSFFHRDRPGHIRIVTRGATAGVEGTEFVLAVNDQDRTVLSVVDGRVRFGNDQATLVLTNGPQAVADLGQAPSQTAGFIANNLLQWCFYYPAVLDPDELPLTSEEQNALAGSLAAYRSGDLLAALAQYPAGRQPASDAERAYRAGLLLSVGRVDETESVLSRLSTADPSGRPQRLATALRQLIAAVKRQPNPETNSLQLTSELLAGSYFEQAQGIRETSLDSALQLARRAATNSPQFGFAWERLAELEFSYGHTRAALEALEKSLALSPRNAQALALKGFLLAANNDTREATEWFNRAIAVDSALGNAWLGRGLCRIRRNDVAGGREDLLIAAALEPQRADLRRYLAKAYATTYDNARAEKELQLAKKLDPNDPTAWLYSALLNQNNNRINQGIRDLEKSAELNENRSVYRSQLLLDQDHAVRSANLANLYADAGMPDAGVREASSAVTYDYANYSAHLFLANSYEAQRGFAGANLRYETPAQTEFMIANLLAPVGAGPVSATVSQQEYSRLFERDRLGLVSRTEYLSRGAWQENFAQYGTYDSFNYSLEGIYISDPGQRAKNAFEDKELSLNIKQQITPQDTLLFGAAGFQRNAGDISQTTSLNQGIRTKEENQDPNLEIGWHHEWSPGVHTLFVGGRLLDDFWTTNANSGALTAVLDGTDILAFRLPPAITDLHQSLEVYSAELQQIFEQVDHSTVLGGLYQHTDFHTRDLELGYGDPSYFPLPWPAVIANETIETSFERMSVYGYHSWQILDPLLLVGGLSYDWMSLPKNWNSPPVTPGQVTKDQWSPKAGIVWTPAKNTTVRAAYTRSLTGANIDQSFRIEPTQVVGLNQSYRSLFPESIVGATSGNSYDTYAVSLEKKFDTGTYAAIRGEIINADAKRAAGTYVYDVNVDYPASTLTDYALKEQLYLKEESLLVTLDQLLGQDWTVGARYRLTQADLHRDYLVPALEPDWYYDTFPPHQQLTSLLHQLNLHANFNHVSGLFATFEAIWYRQTNTGTLPGPSDDFWQVNAVGGYNFFHRRARLEMGVLNITDQDYSLNPLTIQNELPRERTFVTRLLIAF